MAAASREKARTTAVSTADSDKIGLALSRFFSKKLVYPVSPWVILVITLIIIGLLFAFLSFYRPFGLEQLQKNRFLVNLLISGTSGLSVAVLILLAPKVIPTLFAPEKFNNTGFLILCFAGLILSTALNLVLNAGVRSLREAGIQPFQLAVLFLDIVIAPGLLLINVVDWRAKKLIIYNLNPYLSPVATKDHKPSDELLQIRNPEGGLLLEIPAVRFLCAYSNQNYADVYHVTDANSVVRTMVRISFTRLFENLKEHPNMIRCHRTRIINLFHATELITYDRKTLVRIRHMEEAIPVARDYPIRDHFPDRQEDLSS